MVDTPIRIYYREPSGALTDGQFDMDLADFGGVLPIPGDLILAPTSLPTHTRDNPSVRKIWTVVHRAFNGRDLGGDGLVLIVDERDIEPEEAALAPGG